MSTIDDARFGRDIYVPIDPDEAIRVTPTGDLQSVTGYANLSAWIEGCAVTNPGELVHRPDFGGGLMAAVETANTLTGRSRLANRMRPALLKDGRFREIKVSAAQGLPSDTTRSDAVTVTILATPNGDNTAFSVTLAATE